MARLTLDDALRALAITLLFAGACESRAPIGPNRQPIQTGPCDDCHAAPPATGAHLAHAAPEMLDGLAYGDLRILEDVATGGTRYAFGCGHCHPVDPAAHEADLGADGLPDVVLVPPDVAVTGDAIKLRNTPQAAWDPATGTCSGVYCHSSGRDSLGPPFGYVTTPAWTATSGALGCDGCHGNPPRYPSAGSESAAPNSHIQVASDGWGWGHFGGMPGPFHGNGSFHGAQTPGYASAPITCQACHFETVDPAHTQLGGFYYLDTSGDYALGRVVASSQCATCHGDGKRAPANGGAVLPLRHVNGRPDVVFDARLSLPDGYATGLPALATPAPMTPYYVSPFNVDLNGWPLPPGTELRLGLDGTTQVLSVSLEPATYDPTSRTCSNVGCHLSRQSLVDSGALGTPPPLRWGDEYKLYSSCQYCHSML